MENQNQNPVVILTEDQKQEIRDQIIRENGGIIMSDHVKEFCENKVNGSGLFGMGGKPLESLGGKKL